MNENQLKSLNGQLSKGSLQLILVPLQEEKIISFCTVDYRKGYPGHDSDQFYAPFYVEFSNGEGWLLFSVNSIRSDRVNNQQWNAYHLKQISQNITKALLVVPSDITDNEKEWKCAQAYDRKLNGEMFSAIDGVIKQDDLITLIRAHS